MKVELLLNILHSVAMLNKTEGKDSRVKLCILRKGEVRIFCSFASSQRMEEMGWATDQEN